MKSFFKKIIVFILTFEAKRVLKKYRPKIVAVTGSVGKTSTKDAVYTLLSAVAFARKSEKSFNSELGVPLTILGLPTAWSSIKGWLENIIEGLHLLLTTQPYPEWLIVEVGADRPGDIKALSWLAPNIVIFTRFPDVPVHVEYFASPAELIAEKRELKKALRADGTLIVNHDDPMMQSEEIVEGQHLMTYGFTEGATVFADNYQIEYRDARPIGVSCMVHFQHDHVPLVLEGTVGRHHLYSILAALSVAVVEGVTFTKAVAALETHTSPAGRMRILEGIQRTTILDDTYNSSPIAVEAGLNALTTIKVSGKKVVVLGDMMELGDFSVEEHRKAGEQAALVADVFVTVGVRMLGAGEAARAMGGVCTDVKSFKTALEAAQYLPTIVGEGDLIYVKGSQSTRMERVVEALLNDQGSAASVLVRQDREWKER
jgi:UDP-N-acetylmuramoyl-tripeptide--D-alanyl-D-alanine ligase